MKQEYCIFVKTFFHINTNIHIKHHTRILVIRNIHVMQRVVIRKSCFSFYCSSVRLTWKQACSTSHDNHTAGDGKGVMWIRGWPNNLQSDDPTCDFTAMTKTGIKRAVLL